MIFFSSLNGKHQNNTVRETTISAFYACTNKKHCKYTSSSNRECVVKTKKYEIEVHIIIIHRHGPRPLLCPPTQINGNYPTRSSSGVVTVFFFCWDRTMIGPKFIDINHTQNPLRRCLHHTPYYLNYLVLKHINTEKYIQYTFKFCMQCHIMSNVSHGLAAKCVVINCNKFIFSCGRIKTFFLCKANYIIA